MKGLALAKQYWEEIALPQISARCPDLLEHAAFGLVGEGSECFGYDDLLSRDHDWGPGFCIWMNDRDFAEYGKAAIELYASLPKEYLGFKKLNQIQQTIDRTGVQSIRCFYSQFLGIDHLPSGEMEWFSLPEFGLSTATNGEVFLDHPGEFTRFRNHLLSYFPKDVWLKKLAAHCALAAQAGQYNYIRCQKRNDTVASFTALSQFIEHIQAIVFLLNKTYRPYYKWTQKAMETLPILGVTLAKDLEALAISPMGQSTRIETISQTIISHLQASGLSHHSSDFLLHHAEQIQAQIQSPVIKQLHLMAE